jgi:putative ABC transport system permease protein
VGALATTRLLSTALYNVSATDPLTFVAMAGLLLVVGSIASLIPARRALRVEPTVALQEQ